MKIILNYKLKARQNNENHLIYAIYQQGIVILFCFDCFLMFFFIIEQDTI
jgi:hypothetical protein